MALAGLHRQRRTAAALPAAPPEDRTEEFASYLPETIASRAMRPSRRMARWSRGWRPSGRACGRQPGHRPRGKDEQQGVGQYAGEQFARAAGFPVFYAAPMGWLDNDTVLIEALDSDWEKSAVLRLDTEREHHLSHVRRFCRTDVSSADCVRTAAFAPGRGRTGVSSSCSVRRICDRAGIFSAAGSASAPSG